MSLVLVCTMNDPALFDCEDTPIPASSDEPVQIVQSLPGIVTHIAISNGLNSWVNLYKGQPGNESLVCVISGEGSYTRESRIEKGERLSLRSIDDSPIESGKIALEFCQNA